MISEITSVPGTASTGGGSRLNDLAVNVSLFNREMMAYAHFPPN
jgi:hypothetical protein